MSLTLLRAPAGAGKTHRVIEAILQRCVANPLARVWVVLPTARQEFTLRQRLIEAGGQTPLFNVELFNFYTLYDRILLGAHQPIYEVGGMARTILLRYAIRQALEQHPSSLFSSIGGTLGFAQLVGRLIDELKSGRVMPEHFGLVASTPKDRELADMYMAYQHALKREEHQHHDGVPLADVEGLGWLALEMLQNPRYDPRLDLLVVDGFDQLSVVQADLIRAFAFQYETLVTLSQMPERVNRRVEQAAALLKRQDGPPVIEEFLAPRPFASASLQHVVNHAFSDEPQRIPLTDDALTFIEAANPTLEARAVMRRIRALLSVDATCRPDDVMVAVRDWAMYGPALQAEARALGVPVVAHYGQPLTEHPLGVFVEGLLRLHEDDFPLRDVLEVLYSPYVCLADDDALDAGLLEQMGQRFKLISGKADWLTAVTAATRPERDEQGNELDPLLDGQMAEVYHRRLSAFFAALSLPEQASLRHYVQQVEEWFGNDGEASTDPVRLNYSLNVVDAVRRLASGADSSRELEALRAFKQALRQLLNAYEVVGWATHRDELMPREVFLSDLRAALASVTLRDVSGRAGRVLITLVTEARGLPHRHVFITGLSEGLFPAKTSDDPLYLDHERQSITARLAALGYPVGLATRTERSGDEGVFYELIGLPRETLTLSRPYMQNSAEWPASYLWRAVRGVFSTVPQGALLRVRQGDAPDLEQVVNSGELALALVADGNNPRWGGYAAYLEQLQPGYLERVRLTSAVQRDRWNEAVAWDEHTGDLGLTPWADDFAQRYGEGAQWSVSALEALGASAYRFFAQRVLKLEEWQEVEDTFDIRAIGIVVHHVMNMLYGEFMQAGLSIHPDSAEAALALTLRHLPELLDSAPQWAAFADGVAWQLERRRKATEIEGFIRQDFAGDNALTEKFKELADVERWPLLREWQFERVPLTLPDGSDIWMRGTFDRVDVAHRGDELLFVLIDYKTSSSPYKAQDFELGVKVQMPVYICVLRHLLQAGKLDAALRQAGLDPALPKRVLGGIYWSSKGEFKSLYAVQASDEEQIARTLGHVERVVKLARRGHFIPYAANPDKSTGRCVSFCAYQELCLLCAHQLDKPV